MTLSFANLLGGSQRSALDLPVAGLAGLAVAFAAFTIPNDLIAEAIGATGIDSIIPAAQPPLGTTARSLIAVVGAFGAFSAAFLLLRWLDRFATRAPARAVAVTVEPEAPRIRKSDAHPDAPPRRPISASRDLGEPAPPARPATVQAQPAVAPQPAVVPQPTPADPKPSLGDLMARLERGLAKIEQPSAPDAFGEMDEMASPAPASTPPAAASTPHPSESPPPAAAPSRPTSNDRLQSAIEGLRALSVRV